jgi:hypothetical protein
MGFFSGTKARNEQLSTVTPQQAGTNVAANTGVQQLIPYLLQNLMGGPQGQGRFDFGPIAQRARTQFEQQTIPSIAERFNTLGRGALSSSGFAQTLGGAGAGLQEGLAAQESQFGLQQQGLLQQLLGQLGGIGSQQQFENIYHPEQPGFLQTALPGLIAAGATAFGGPLAGAAGGALANALFGSVGQQAPQKVSSMQPRSNMSNLGGSLGNLIGGTQHLPIGGANAFNIGASKFGGF